jgi:hypothetical protein
MPDRASGLRPRIRMRSSGGCIPGRRALRIRHPGRRCPAHLRMGLRARRRYGGAPTTLFLRHGCGFEFRYGPVAALDEVLDGLFPCGLLPVQGKTAFGPPFAGLSVPLLLPAYCHLPVCVIFKPESMSARPSLAQRATTRESWYLGGHRASRGGQASAGLAEMTDLAGLAIGAASPSRQRALRHNHSPEGSVAGA